MTLYYQHIGRALWARDAPRTLGSEEEGLRRFQFEDVEGHLTDTPSPEVSAIRDLVAEVAPTGFQIWGLPGGAAGVLRTMVPGDSLLLLESEDFRYVGQVLHRLSEPSWELSSHLWGEQRFPLILFLQGHLVRYGWHDFKEDFAFAPNYGMRGNTMRLAPERVAASRFGTEEAFIAALLRQYTLDFANANREFALFAERAAAHLRLVRERSEQSAFRLQVLARQGASCSVCGFALLEGLEAAHLVPKSASGTDDPRNGLVLCALHHRLFDAGLFSIDPTSLAVIPAAGISLAELHVSRGDLTQLRSHVREEALRWNADSKR